ncbi:hypothetical protein MNBD_GAMMA08-800 [hydrothermal vent metagenome]|uniref:Spondin domain-containing protein n=1 Tax=hydrothermal vent metagenome TaxID=652676 RepID=A0A3B0XRQ3_9ZZZZ
MISKNVKKLLAVAIAGCVFSSASYADPHTATYEISITNLTNAAFLSRPVVAMHTENFKLFTLGSPNTSPGLEVIAETGSPTVLVDELKLLPEISEVRFLGGNAPNNGLLPGETVTGTFTASKEFSHFSVYSMIAPSNDAFISVNGIRVPYKHKTIFSPGYDAGTEANNERCNTDIPTNVSDPDSIPIPPQMRPNICVFTPLIPAPPIAAVGSPGEGKILIHRGFQGVGDLNPAMFDWRNPTAQIVIKSISRK